MRVIAANRSGPIRNDGGYIVVPVSMIVEGVLKGAYVPTAEFSATADQWDGRPVVLGHPERNGEYVSANAPDVPVMGRLFNTRVEGDRLLSEAWIDREAAEGIAPGVTDALMSGATIEVSTGYRAAEDPTPGNYQDQEYQVVHRGIAPDHLAVLLDTTGACSVADGCGMGARVAMKINEAVATISRALGLKANCECEDTMDIMKRAETLRANEKLTAKQFEALQNMDPEQRAMASTILEAMLSDGAGEMPGNEDGMEDPEDNVDAMAGDDKPQYNSADIDRIVANRVDEHLRRRSVADRLRANEANPLSDADLQSLPVDTLERIEKSVRPTDYSGSGAMSVNAGVADSNVQPLRPSRGIRPTAKGSA